MAAPPRWPLEGCVVARVLASFGHAEISGRGDRLVNVCRVIFPIGRNLQRACGRKPARGQLQERGLDDAALVMPFLWPGIREIQIYSRQAPIANLLFQDFYRIVSDDPQVGEAKFVRTNQAMPDARFVYFNPDVVGFRMCGSLMYQGLAVAKADLKHPLRNAPENGVEIQTILREFNAVTRP